MRKLLPLAALALACGGSTSPVSPAFQPEIANATDTFQFQVTGVQNGSASLTYAWQNTGTRATVNQSASITAGAVTLTVKDAAGAVVYTGSLAQHGTFTSSAGAAGGWTLQVDFAGASGTVNFRAQKG